MARFHRAKSKSGYFHEKHSWAHRHFLLRGLPRSLRSRTLLSGALATERRQSWTGIVGVRRGSCCPDSNDIRHSKTWTQIAVEILLRRHRYVALHHGVYLRGQRRKGTPDRRMGDGNTVEISAAGSARRSLSHARNAAGSRHDAPGVPRDDGLLSGGASKAGMSG